MHLLLDLCNFLLPQIECHTEQPLSNSCLHDERFCHEILYSLKQNLEVGFVYDQMGMYYYSANCNNIHYNQKFKIHCTRRFVIKLIDIIQCLIQQL